MSGRLLHINNTSGGLFFSTDAHLTSNAKQINLKSSGPIQLSTDKTITLEPQHFISKASSNQIISIINENNDNNITSNKEAILLKNDLNKGGITAQSGNDGHHIISTGDINLNAINGTIKIGASQLNLENMDGDFDETDNLTDNIVLESLRKITINSEDFYTIASDSIQFISQSGDISFSNQIGSSFLKISDNKLYINKNNTSANDYILDITLDNQSLVNDGIKITSNNNKTEPEINLVNNKLANLSLGLTSQSNLTNTTFYASISNHYLYTTYNLLDNNIVSLSKNIYFEKDKKTITFLNKKENKIADENWEYVVSSLYQSSNFQLQASIKSSKLDITAKHYKIEITKENKFTYYTSSNNNNNNNNNNVNSASQQEITITKTPILLDNQIEIVFPIEKGYNVGDYWIFDILYKIKIKDSSIGSDNNLLNQRCYFVNTPINNSYITTNNNTDLQLETNSYSRIKLGNQGGISINSDIPKPHTFTLNTNLERETTILDNISTYDTQYKDNMGYFIVYEELPTTTYSNIILEHYLEEGQLDINFKKQRINSSQNGFHQQPTLTYLYRNRNVDNNTKSNDFIIMWLKYNKEDNNYNLYSQIYTNNKKRKNFDIPLGVIYNSEKCVDLNSIQINNNTILISWCGEDSDVHNFSIYGILIDFGCNIIKDRFQISNSSQYSYYNPVPYCINSNEYIIFYQEKVGELYNIKYKNININTNINTIEEIYLISTYSLIKPFYDANTLKFYIPFNDHLATNNYKQITSVNNLYIVKDINTTLEFKTKITKINDNILYFDMNTDMNNNDTLHEGDIISIYTNDDFLMKTKIVIKNENNIIISKNSDFNICLYSFQYNNDNKQLTVCYNTYNLFTELQDDTKSIIQMLKINNYILLASIINNNTIHYLLLDENTKEIKQYNTINSSFYKKTNLITTHLNNNIMLSWIENNKVIIKHIEPINPTLNLYNHFQYNKSRNNLTIGKQDKLLNSTLHINGSFSSSFKIIDENYYLTNTDNTILVDTSSRDITIYLNNNETFYGIKNTIKIIKGDNKVFIKTIGRTLIDGEHEFIMGTIYDKITVQSTGIEWFII